MRSAWPIKCACAGWRLQARRPAGNLGGCVRTKRQIVQTYADSLALGLSAAWCSLRPNPPRRRARRCAHGRDSVGHKARPLWCRRNSSPNSGARCPARGGWIPHLPPHRGCSCISVCPRPYASRSSLQTICPHTLAHFCPVPGRQWWAARAPRRAGNSRLNRIHSIIAAWPRFCSPAG